MDATTEAFLAELEVLAPDPRVARRTEVSVIGVEASYDGRIGGLFGALALLGSVIERGRLDEGKALLVFEGVPDEGDTPLLVVPIDRDVRIGELELGAAGVAYGELEPGRAVVIDVPGRRLYSSRPPRRPTGRDKAWPGDR